MVGTGTKDKFSFLFLNFLCFQSKMALNVFFPWLKGTVVLIFGDLSFKKVQGYNWFLTGFPQSINGVRTWYYDIAKRYIESS